MRRHPTRERTPPPRKVAPPGPPLAQNVGDPIEPFLVSGGLGIFPVLNEGFDPRDAGVQLVSSIYVPRGRQGFIKQLRVAPFCPPVFADPWLTSGAANNAATWRDFGGTLTTESRPAVQNGVYTTPFAWESFFLFSEVDPIPPPIWRWSLRFVQGDALAAKATKPFNSFDPTTWQFVDSLPVPASAYPGGLPGYAPGPKWNEQRVQVIQADELTCHVPVPEDTTACLFTRWVQQPVIARAYGTDGAIIYYSLGGGERPLLPSFGQMLGYTQALNTPPVDEHTLNAAAFNIRKGWGG
jgi:hypothetical protein